MVSGNRGKILKVDLSRLTYAVEEKSEEFFRTVLGGSALASYYLLTEMKGGEDPLGPDNLLVFAVSVITGAPVPGTNRFTVAGKSPLTGGFGEAEAGGYWAVELKRAGYAAIVIRGKAPRPVYLYIQDGAVEFREAGGLWGRDTGHALKQIRAELGDEKVRVVSIGQGGENLVRYACVVDEAKHTGGRTGMGAVMGSKNLKAIAVRGTQALEFADPQKLRELSQFYLKNFRTHPIQSLLYEGGTIGWDIESLNGAGILPTKNFRGGSFDQYEQISYTAISETVLRGRGSCWGCPVRCKLVTGGGKYEIDPLYGGPEYETTGAFGSNMLIGDIELVSKAHELCNRYGLDTISTGMTITFAMDCYEAGILTAEDTGGLDLRFGNAEAVLQLIDQIAFREGFGALLAEGSARAAAKLGRGAERFTRTVKQQEAPMHEPRGKAGLALAFALSPTGADHVRAPHDLLFEEGKFGVKDLKEFGILRGLPGRDLGPEKVRFFYYGHQTWNLFNSLSLCAFIAGPGKLFNMTHIMQVVNAATGWETSLFELMKAGERTVTMARLFNVREGMDSRDDMLPEVFFTPLETGPLTGKSVDRETFLAARSMYYDMMGWEHDSGIPTPSRLAELNIADLRQFA